MILIIGGAWQGKRDFAMREFGLQEENIYSCTGVEIDFSARCIDRLEEYVLACVREGKDALADFEKQPERWQNSVLICRDISCGVVPMDMEMRLWRNETGRLCKYLAAKAQRVSRIFCGLEQRLK